MYKFNDIEQSVDKANEVLNDLQTDHSDLYRFPLPIYEICEQVFGFSVFMADTGTTSGAIMSTTEEIEGYETSKVILLNKENAPGRRLFTAAHELGHYLLHSDDNKIIAHRDDESMNNNPLQEKEANDFAANLLMPAEKIYQSTQSFFDGDVFFDGYNFHNVENYIAASYGVTVPAAKQRLCNLGYLI